MTEGESLILCELRALRQEVAELRAERRPKAPPFTETDHELARAIFACLGNGSFSAADVTEWARPGCRTRGAARLHDALRQVIPDPTPQRVGKFLSRAAGHDLNGLKIKRQGDERWGALWTIFATRNL